MQNKSESREGPAAGYSTVERNGAAELWAELWCRVGRRAAYPRGMCPGEGRCVSCSHLWGSLLEKFAADDDASDLARASPNLVLQWEATK